MEISASILACDPLYLARDVKEAEMGGADIIHVDIMDGQYVENLTFGIHTVEYLSKMTGLPIDVHLEVLDPERYIENFADAGAKMITVQLDTCRCPIRTLNTIRQYGAKAGLAINPHTGMESVEYLVDYFDFLLLMSVEPGFGGQPFQNSVFSKIERAKEAFEGHPKPPGIGVDGGVGLENIKQIYQAGVRMAVVGTSIFNDGSIKENIKALKGKARKN